MRFLSISKPTAAMGMLPPEVILKIVGTSLASMQQLREERKLLEYYYSPKGCSIVILDYDSAEEWVSDQRTIPILNYMDEEIYPLADGLASMKGMLEALQAKAE